MTAVEKGGGAFHPSGPPGSAGAKIAAVALLASLVVPPPVGGAPLFPGAEDHIRAAVAGEPDREELRQAAGAMAGAGFPHETFLSFLETARDLSQAGISVSDLSCKVKEGIAKKVDPPRVMAVVRDRASKLKDGRVLVLDLSSEGVVFLDQQMAFRVVADYLSRGIPAQDLRQRILARSLADYPALEVIIR